MEDQKTTQSIRKKILFSIALVLATIFVLFFGFAIVPKIIGEYIGYFSGESLHNAGWEGIVMELTFYVFLTGYIFVWWKKCTGGIIILLASVIQMGPFLIIDGNLGSLIFGLPMLIVGVLFMISCKNTSTTT